MQRDRKKKKAENGREEDGRKRDTGTPEGDKIDEEMIEREKEVEHEICVVTWNVNKSSAQNDFINDMAQFQANVVMFQETQNWPDDGTAEELGWTVPKEEKDGKAAIAVKRRNLNLLRHSRKSTRWILVVLANSGRRNKFGRMLQDAEGG